MGVFRLFSGNAPESESDKKVTALNEFMEERNKSLVEWKVEARTQEIRWAIIT